MKTEIRYSLQLAIQKNSANAIYDALTNAGYETAEMCAHAWDAQWLANFARILLSIRALVA